MIIARYLSRQVFSTTLVVVALLTLVIMGSRLIRYFGLAAQGNLDIGALLGLVGYRLPEFLTLILPLGFFIALVLVFGRLYVEHEMAVFNASGISRLNLGKKLLALTAFFCILQFVMMAWLSPWGNRRFDEVTVTQAVRSGFDLVRPQEFISSGVYTIYAGSLSEDKSSLEDIFFYQKAKQADQSDMIIVAKQAKRVVNPNDNASSVDLYQGRRYSYRAGEPAYVQAEFEHYRLRLEPEQEKKIEAQRPEAMTMQQLLQHYNTNSQLASELGWRIFAPFIILVALFLALPLSEVSPRQGRYHRLFPAIMIFASLIVAMMAVKTRISKGQMQIWIYPVILMTYVFLAWLIANKPWQRKTVKHSNHLANGDVA
ncbi:LPS export ABC transporter permease LptF [Acinetobacter sp. c1-l78]|uniref:LPS export ABC transporter permease LptF n=1 Tax=Acinetobacter sp. c1-l78 TaxID=3342803 RepID=UPI0035BB2871